MLYLRKDKGNLIRISKISRRSDGSIININTDYPLDPNGPVITTGIFSSIPFDWPDWQKDQVVVEEDKGKKLIKQEIKEKSLMDAMGKSYNGHEVTMKLIYKKNEEERVWVRTVQNWKTDAKWWEEIKRYDEKGEIISEAVLIRE